MGKRSFISFQMGTVCVSVARSTARSLFFVTVSLIIFFFILKFILCIQNSLRWSCLQILLAAPATKCIFLVRISRRSHFNRNMLNLRMSNNLDKWAQNTCSDTWVIKFDLHRLFGYAVWLTRIRWQFRRMAHDAVFTYLPHATSFHPKLN